MKYGLPVPGGEDDDAALFEVADRAAADERLGDRAHFDRGQHAGRDRSLLERVLEREGVDDRGQHPHVVGGRAVHPARAGGQAAEDVAAADDDRRLDAEALNFGDVFGDAVGDRGVDPVVLLAHEGFAGQFQEDARVGGNGRVARGHVRLMIIQGHGCDRCTGAQGTPVRWLPACVERRCGHGAPRTHRRTVHLSYSAVSPSLKRAKREIVTFSPVFATALATICLIVTS